MTFLHDYGYRYGVYNSCYLYHFDELIRYYRFAVGDTNWTTRDGYPGQGNVWTRPEGLRNSVRVTLCSIRLLLQNVPKTLLDIQGSRNSRRPLFLSPSGSQNSTYLGRVRTLDMTQSLELFPLYVIDFYRSIRY